MRLLLTLLIVLLGVCQSHAQDRLSECRAAGYGYLQVPGTELCIAPRGFVRAEYLGGLRLPPFDMNSDAKYGTIAKTQLGFDFVATGSEYPNGGRVRLAIARESGLPTVWTDGVGGQRTLLEVDEAWVRVGPLMAGRGPSRFDFYRDAFNYTPLPISNLTANFVSLRVPLTSWLYAEASAENAYERNIGLIRTNLRALNKPDLIGVLRASVSWPYPGELHFSATIPKSENGLFAWQAGGAFDLGGERPHLLILQMGMSRGPPSFVGLDRGLFQSITGADLAFSDLSATRALSTAILYRRPIFGDRWTATNFVGFGMIKPGFVASTGLTGPAALMMAGGNLEWRSKEGLMIGTELSYVVSETPADPYTRYAEGVVFRLRIERGF
jgi:hypothetical protein